MNFWEINLLERQKAEGLGKIIMRSPQAAYSSTAVKLLLLL